MSDLEKLIHKAIDDCTLYKPMTGDSLWIRPEDAHCEIARTFLALAASQPKAPADAEDLAD